MKKHITKEYKDYLKSDSWKERREQFYKKYGKICAKCRAFKHIQLHHKSYHNLMSEPDDDLIALCNPCHQVFHKIFHRTSHDNTRMFLNMSLEHYANYMEELRKEKERKKALRVKKEKKISYRKEGRVNRLSKKSVNLVRRQVLEEPTFDFIKKQIQQNFNKRK